MTCVIKQSLFTHQKLCRCVAEFAWQNVFTCQEINNLSCILHSHLHRTLIAVQRRRARYSWMKIRLAWQADKMGERKRAPMTIGKSPLNRQESEFSIRCLQVSDFQYNWEKPQGDIKSTPVFSCPKRYSLTPPRRQQQHTSKNIWNQLPT